MLEIYYSLLQYVIFVFSLVLFSQLAILPSVAPMKTERPLSATRKSRSKESSQPDNNVDEVLRAMMHENKKIGEELVKVLSSIFVFKKLEHLET